MSESINENVLGLCEVDGLKVWEFFDLNEDSFVVDLGSFRGDFSKYIYETYNCRVDAYDPIGINNLISHPKFTFRKLAVFDGSEIRFTFGGTSSHILGENGEPLQSIDILEITKEKIDLMKVNIEGAEIVVLQRADLSNVKQLLVEFHLFRACEEDKELAIADIEKTFDKIMSYGFKFKQINETGPAVFFYK